MPKQSNNLLTALTSIIDYLLHKQIFWFEKLFVFGFWILYVISPVNLIPDFLPGGTLDDIGVSLLVIAFMNYRIDKVSERQQSSEQKTKAEVVDVEVLDYQLNSPSEDKHNSVPDNFFEVKDKS